MWDQAETRVALVLHPNQEMSEFPDPALLDHFLDHEMNPLLVHLRDGTRLGNLPL